MRFTLLLALPFLSAMTAMAANVNVDRLDKKWGANDECLQTCLSRGCYTAQCCWDKCTPHNDYNCVHECCDGCIPNGPKMALA